MSWLKIVLGIIVFSLTLSYIVIPWAAQLASSFRLRATKLSPLSSRGIEWRDKGSAHAAEPTLRVERVYWSVGGCTKGGRLTLNVEGVTIRVPKRQKSAPEKPKVRSPYAVLTCSAKEKASSSNKAFRGLLPAPLPPPLVVNHMLGVLAGVRRYNYRGRTRKFRSHCTSGSLGLWEGRVKARIRRSHQSCLYLSSSWKTTIGCSLVGQAHSLQPVVSCNWQGC